MQKMTKKGQGMGGLGLLLPSAILMIVFVVAVGFGLELLEDTQADMTANSEAYNATGDGITGIAKFGTKSKLIVSAIIFLIILGLLLAMASFKMR